MPESMPLLPSLSPVQGVMTIACGFALFTPRVGAVVFLPQTERDPGDGTQLTLSAERREDGARDAFAERMQRLAEEFGNRAMQGAAAPQEAGGEPPAAAPAGEVPQAEPLPDETHAISPLQAMLRQHAVESAISAPAPIRFPRSPALAHTGFGSLFLISAALGATLGARTRK